MTLYIVLAIILLFALMWGVAYQPKNAASVGQPLFQRNIRFDRVLFWCVLFVLWILTAFRGRIIGNDTETYLLYFVRIKESGVDKNYAIELGYQYYCLFIGKITTNENAILIVTATICYLGVGIYVSKYSDNLMFSLVLLFCICFSNFTNILRQSMAMTLCLYAYQSLKNKKFIRYILWVLSASFFHISALVFFVLAFHKFVPKNLLFIVLFALVCALLSITNSLSTILRKLIPEYASYFNGKYVNTGRLAVTYELLRAFVFLVVVFKAYRSSLKPNTLVLMNFTMILLLDCFAYSVNLFARASTYFMFVAIVELPNAIMKLNKKTRKKLIFLIGFVMLAYFLVALILRPTWNYLYPYVFWK